MSEVNGMSCAEFHDSAAELALGVLTGRERAEALARRIGAGHWSPGYLPAPAVSPMTM